MKLDWSLGLGLRPLAFAVCLALAALAGAPADAVEAPAGSRNFNPPGYVPNYFSSEGASFRGGATAGPAQPGANPVVVAPAPRGMVAEAASHQPPRRHAGRAATGHGRLRFVHGRASGHRHLVHAHAAGNGKMARPGMAHPPVRHAATKAVAAKSRPAPNRVKHLARAHG